MVKTLPANAEDLGSVPGSGRSPGGGHVNPLQYSPLENPWTEEAGGYSSWGHRVGRDQAQHNRPAISWIDIKKKKKPDSI